MLEWVDVLSAHLKLEPQDTPPSPPPSPPPIPRVIVYCVLQDIVYYCPIGQCNIT